MISRRRLRCVSHKFLFTISLSILWASAGSGLAAQDTSANRASVSGASDTDHPARTYVLGPGDRIEIHALQADDISDKPIDIDSAGQIRLPLLGTVQCSGHTLDEVEQELRGRLQKYFKDPQVVVSLVEQRNQPVSIIGAVKNPGVHQVQGQKTVVEMLAEAGGLAADSGDSIRITRKLKWGPIPLPDATEDSSGNFSIAEIRTQTLMNESNPSENILVKPDDIISVPRAGMVYVVGEVKNAGGFLLKDRNTISVLQALSLAQGLSRTASPKNARILRPDPGAPAPKEIPIDLSRMLAGQIKDASMEPNDVLFIPNSAAKSASLRGIEAAIQLGTGLAIWR